MTSIIKNAVNYLKYNDELEEITNRMITIHEEMLSIYAVIQEEIREFDNSEDEDEEIYKTSHYYQLVALEKELKRLEKRRNKIIPHYVHFTGYQGMF